MRRKTATLDVQPARTEPIIDLEGADEVPEPLDDDPLIGTTPLGQYRIDRKLGAGAFGAVYLAEQLGIGRKAVIKVLHGKVADDDGMSRRFEREAEVLAALDHPHIVRLYNFGRFDDGQLFLAMEYGGDTTLEGEIKRAAPFRAERALLLTGQICEALSNAHANGVVHRDLKPANILLGKRDNEDWARVADLGIAKIIGDGPERESAKLTRSGGTIGTPAYMSPEQAQGLPLDGRSDLYSLGCLLYEMLTNRLPYNASTQSELLRAHVTQPPRPMKDAGVQVPKEVERFVRRALEKEPNARFSSAQEMAGEAARLATRLAHGGSGLLRTSLWTLLIAAAIGACVFGYLRSPMKTTPSEAVRAVDPTPSPKPDPGQPRKTKESIEGPQIVELRLNPGAESAPTGDDDSKAAANRGMAVELRPTRQTVSGHSAQAHLVLPVTVDAGKANGGGNSANDQQAIQLVVQANNSLQANALDEAFNQFQKILDLHPSKEVRAQAYRGLAQTADKLGHDQDALKFYQLYKPFCTPAERPAWDARLKQLQADLGLDAAPENK